MKSAPGEPTIYTFRFGFRNERTIHAVFVVEPWACDYTVEPGQELELVVRSSSPDLWFSLVSAEDGRVAVYLEGDASMIGVEWDVFVEGVEVDMGHGRRP